MFLPVVLPPLFAALEEEVKFSMEAADPDDDGEVRRHASATACCGFKVVTGTSRSAYQCISFFRPEMYVLMHTCSCNNPSSSNVQSRVYAHVLIKDCDCTVSVPRTPDLMYGAGTFCANR